MTISSDLAPPSSASDSPAFTLTIDAMAYGGKGIGRVDGKVWFVDGAIAGDHVEARPTADSGRYGEAAVQSLLTPSPWRGPAACAYADRCGGCQWQGVAYDQQLVWKTGFVTSALQRIGKLGADAKVATLGAPEVLGYRNRILLRLHWDQDAGLRLGYFQRGSRILVPIARCAIAAPALNAAITAVHQLDLGALPALKARLELQEVPGEDGAPELLITLYPAEGPREAMERFVALLQTLPRVRWAGLVFALREAPALLFDTDLQRQFLTRPGQFQQVNVAHNRTLRRLVADAVAATKPRRILDVFCGSGNLSLPLADGQRYVEGVESNEQAIAVARENVRRNALTNVTYLAGDAEKHLWKCARAGEEFDLVILDPPRQGMYKGMVPLKKIYPQHILYVSCDPTTLARDLGYLCRKDGYRITSVTALDFFPNTYHIETLVALERL